MNIRLKLFIIGLALLCFMERNEIKASTPGIGILENEELLQRRIENMNSCFTPFYNEEVKRRLSFMVKTKAAYTESMLGRMVQYYPLIDSLLKANGLPTDLKYITVIESSLKPSVRSYAGAAGLWQFMEATGESFGLRVNRTVDERLDPYLATHAAIKYLKYLHDIYDNWALVLMAYNSGPGRVNRAIEQAGESTYAEIAPYLPRETREYIPKFLAASFFMKNYREFGFEPEWPHLDMQFITRRKVYEKVRLSKIADSLGMEVELLEELNPALIRGYIPASTQGYFLTYPSRYADEVNIFFTYLGDVELESQPLDIAMLSPEQTLKSEEKKSERETYYLKFGYTVKTGNSWKNIAQIFGLNPFRLKYWNQSYSPYLYPGQKLILYVPASRKNKIFITLLTTEKFGSLKSCYYLAAVVRNNNPLALQAPNMGVREKSDKIVLKKVVESIGSGNFKVERLNVLMRK